MAIYCAAVRTQVFLWRHLMIEIAISLMANQRGNALAGRGSGNVCAEIVGNLANAD